MRLLTFVIIKILACDFGDGANILAIIPTPFYSHQATFRPLWRELARRGHKITLLTTNLMEPNENITQVDYSGTYKIFEKHEMHELFRRGFGPFEILGKCLTMVDDLIEYQFNHPDVIKVYKKNSKFDLVMTEVLVPIYAIYSAKFKCPFIGLVSMDASPSNHAEIGNAMHPNIYPNADYGLSDEMTFKEKLISLSANTFFFIFKNLVIEPLTDNYVKKYIGDDLPPISDVFANISLLFTLANPIFAPPRSITPKTINLEGRLHLKSSEQLPKDIQDYLDSAKEGCIYFSFGSTVNSNYLTPEAIEIFRTVFEELAPVKVLWKFENETWGQKPKNVKIAKWLPQQDILRHPNVKVFITQGGLQSMEEAIDSAVPMLGMPFFGDQTNNVNKMVTKQFGLRLDVKTMDKESLKKSLLALLNDPLYKKNVDKYSAISKDQPMTGLEKAVWWTEYVLRHGGTEHLRSPSADIPLYQYFFLDIIAFLIVVLIFIVFVVYILIKSIKFIFRKLFGTKNKVKIN